MELETHLKDGWCFIGIGGFVREGISGERIVDAKMKKWRSIGCF